jgi:hypothetical protein
MNIEFERRPDGFGKFSSGQRLPRRLRWRRRGSTGPWGRKLQRVAPRADPTRWQIKAEGLLQWAMHYAEQRRRKSAGGY